MYENNDTGIFTDPAVDPGTVPDPETSIEESVGSAGVPAPDAAEDLPADPADPSEGAEAGTLVQDPDAALLLEGVQLVHKDVMMLFFLILFIYCAGCIKACFRSLNKWNKG